MICAYNSRAGGWMGSRWTDQLVHNSDLFDGLDPEDPSAATLAKSCTSSMGTTAELLWLV